jgi:2-dehydropantoate 2-reductase
MGAGSIGLLYASRIQEAYNQRPKSKKTQSAVTLLMRAHHKPLLNVDGDRLFAPVEILNGNNSTKCNIPVEIVGQADGDSPDINTLLLCTKANDACTALSAIWNRLQMSSRDSQPRIIILSNGALAVGDSILNAFPGNNVDIVYASTTHGAYKDHSDTTKYCIRHAGEGLTHSTDEEFVRICRDIGWKSYKMTDLEMNIMLWKKLAVNCVINPLTAIHGERNGELVGLQHNGQDIRDFMNGVLEEVSCISLKEVQAMHSLVGSNKNELPLQSIQEELSVSSLQDFVDKVISDTAPNISSMLQDVQANRVTEVQFLNGHVCQIAKEKYGIKCPYNRSLYAAVSLLIEKS